MKSEYLNCCVYALMPNSRMPVTFQPEGVEQFYSKSLFVELTKSVPDFSYTFKIEVPSKTQLVPDSIYVEVTVVGNYKFVMASFSIEMVQLKLRSERANENCAR